MTKHWDVYLKYNIHHEHHAGEQRIEADFMRVAGGALVFWDSGKNTKLAFGRDEWSYVRLVENDGGEKTL